jgi:hypothetical protein
VTGAEPCKRCCACHRLLPLSDFALDYARWDHHQRKCKECARDCEDDRRKKSLDIVA